MGWNPLDSLTTSWKGVEAGFKNLGIGGGGGGGGVKLPAGTLTSDAPGRISAFQREAQGLLKDQTIGAFNQNAATQAGIFRDTQRQAGDQFAALGINPAAVLGRLMPQQQMGFAETLGGLRGGAEAGLAQGQMDLSGQVLNALNQIEAYYDSLKLQKYGADKGAHVAAQSAQAGQMNTLLGLAGSLGSAAVLA